MAAPHLHHYTPSETNTPSILHYFTPWAAQLLHHFVPSERITPSHLHRFTPWQSSSNLILPPLNNLPFHFYNILPPLAAQLLPHLTPLEPVYTLTLTTIHPPWQFSSYLILPPLNELPNHSYTILPSFELKFPKKIHPIAAPPLHHFTPLSEKTPPQIHINLPPLIELPPHSCTILPLAVQL